jgi:hypothetical protein
MFVCFHQEFKGCLLKHIWCDINQQLIPPMFVVIIAAGKLLFCKLWFWPYLMNFQSRSITQAVSRWLPNTTAWVRARVWSSGIYGGQSGAGAGFLRVLRFPLPIFIPPNSPSSQSPEAGTIGHSVADVPSGLSSTPHYANNKLSNVIDTSSTNIYIFFPRCFFSYSDVCFFCDISGPT